jgi:hypothetical protein
VDSREGMMANDNKLNLQFFEAPSMKELYNQMQDWQVENRKRLLSISIEQDRESFCCIALTNPTEVVIVDSEGEISVRVWDNGSLQVNTGN